MDFRLTPDQEELRSAARDFARAELPAIAAELERENKPPSHELVRRYAEMGFLGINIPAELGGLGLGNLEALIVLEEFAKISSAVRSEEHTSELQSLMRNSYAVFCLKKTNKK